MVDVNNLDGVGFLHVLLSCIMLFHLESFHHVSLYPAMPRPMELPRGRLA